MYATNYPDCIVCSDQDPTFSIWMSGAGVASMEVKIGGDVVHTTNSVFPVDQWMIIAVTINNKKLSIYSSVVQGSVMETE